MQRARKLMNEGTLGEVTGAMGIQWSSEKRPLPTWYKELPGGLFFDESPHLLYLLDYFLEDVQVQSAWRSKTPSVPGETLERFEARLQGNKGEGLLSMWFGAPMSEWLILISGTNGAFVIDIFRDVLVFFPPEKARTPQYLFEVLLRADRQIWSQMFRWVVTRYTRGSHLFGIDVLVNQFVESIRHDAPSPVAFSNGQKVVALITEILRLSDLRQ
jgi:predicted dehydrogenase